ncbi:MAG: fatty acid desaturase [Hyphomicrobiales bacterium]
MPRNFAAASATNVSAISSCSAPDPSGGSVELAGWRRKDRCTPNPQTFLASCEWLTVSLFASVYVGWMVLVGYHDALPFWILLPTLAVLTTLHSSLQHEALHGHPTRSARFNECFSATPLGLFIPYRRFKRLHLRHHCDENLTDPYDDPESFYLARQDWADLPFGMHVLLRANNTLFGRLVLGPALSIFAFYRSEVTRFLKAPKGRRCLTMAWALHCGGVLSVLFVLSYVEFPIWLYLLGVSYPAMSLLMLRTYGEHQAAESVGPRTAIVEASPIFALLYLNNNLHFVHHRFPSAPWYELPNLYKSHYALLNAENGHYRIAGYWSLFRLFFVTAKEPVAHPFRRRFETVELKPNAGSVKLDSALQTSDS